MAKSLAIKKLGFAALRFSQVFCYSALVSDIKSELGCLRS